MLPHDFMCVSYHKTVGWYPRCKSSRFFEPDSLDKKVLFRVPCVVVDFKSISTDALIGISCFKLVKKLSNLDKANQNVA